MLLNHKLRINLSNLIEVFTYERSCVSRNGKEFSCVVPKYYDVRFGEPLSVQINGYQAMEIVPTITEFTEQGYAYIDTLFEIERKVEKTDGSDGYIYYVFGTDGIMVGYDSSSDINLYHDDNTNKDYIVTPTVYYIENGVITYNGNSYDVEFDENGVVNLQSLGDTQIKFLVQDGEKSKWEDKVRLTFTTPYDKIIPLDDIVCGTVEPYISIDGIEYTLLKEYVATISWEGFQYNVTQEFGYDDTKNEYYTLSYFIDADGNKHEVTFKDNEAFVDNAEEKAEIGNLITRRYVFYNGEKFYEDFNPESPFPNLFSGVITINDVMYHIHDRYVVGNDAEVLLINIDNERFEGQLINNSIDVEAISSYQTNVYEVSDENGVSYIEIDGVRYDTTEVKMVDFNGEKELRKESDQVYSVVLDDLNVVYFKAKTDTQLVLLLNEGFEVDGRFEEKTYEVLTRSKVIVDGVSYYRDPQPFIVIREIDNGVFEEMEREYPFVIERKPTYKLDIIQFTEPNACVCRVNLGNITPSSILNPLFSSIHKEIYFNLSSFVIKTRVPRFGLNKEEKSTIDDMLENGYGIYVDNFFNIVIERKNNNVIIPLQLGSIHGTNLHQEMLVRDKFFKKHIEDSINPIVDMEKEIYYPMKVVDSKLIDVTDIEFYIHLRTRGEDWSVQEDYFARFNTETEVDNVTNDELEDLISVTPSIVQNSWNILDYYEDKLYPEGDKDNKFKYYQPSDLLGFFDFNDMDIFYQKSKVGKSFLRMMIYDSPNPLTQHLLATSTIFLDSNTLFGKFSDNMSNPIDNIQYLNPSSEQGSIQDYISVSTEPITASEAYTFNEENRMSSKIVVNSKLASTNSAEGFYQYIFKEELSTSLHEHTLYLRMQFNHAGHGTVIDLVQPMETKDGTNDLVLIDFSNKDKRKEWKEGVELPKLYNMMFIPIKVKYDLESNKYCWYLPESLSQYHDENKIKFNLYEIKAKN